MPKLHRVHCAEFDSDRLDGKSLKWFFNEDAADCWLRVEDVQRDGSFVLFACGVNVLAHPPTEAERGHISQWAESLDQATVDKIEDASQFSFLEAADFVIFQESPKSRGLHEKKNQ
jgi:hypothetical protein